VRKATIIRPLPSLRPGNVKCHREIKRRIIAIGTEAFSKRRETDESNTGLELKEADD